MTAESILTFVDVNCPVCGSHDSKVLRMASYPRDAAVRELQSVYCPSSDHALMDQVVECRPCGMIYIAPRLEADLIQGGYEAVEDPVFVAQNPQRIRTFANNVRSILQRTRLDPKNKRLLDIGCAGGAFLVAAREAGFEVNGIEPSRWLSEYGRKNYRLDVRQGVLEPGMFPESTFDVISLWDVIEHVPDPNTVLTMVYSLLKPEGYLWVNYPDVGSVAAKLMGWKWPFWLSVHLHYYKRHSMELQLRRAGFEVAYMKAHWQQLQLGYLTERAAAIVPPVKVFTKLVSGIGLASVSCTYNMGQTLVIARRKGK